MNKLLLSAALVAAFGAAALAPQSAMAVDGTITVTGTVNASTCKINGANSPAAINVTLPTEERAPGVPRCCCSATAGGGASLQGNLSASEWVARGLRNALDDEVARLQNGLAVLGSIGSTAPFVGLFGTVWGIYHALMAIGASGQASLDHVAGPVGESLIMTAIGLFVAIPAVLGFNYVNRGNKRVSHRLNRFVHELHVYFITGAKAHGDVRQAPAAPVATKRVGAAA